MLLQYQNFKMCETYKLLTSNSIKPYSIESYAFTLAICETSEEMISVDVPRVSAGIGTA